MVNRLLENLDAGLNIHFIHPQDKLSVCMSTYRGMDRVTLKHTKLAARLYPRISVPKSHRNNLNLVLLLCIKRGPAST
jgi:hypothetical protein